MDNKINGRTPDEIKQAAHCVAWDESHCDVCAYRTYDECSASAVADLLMYVRQLEVERDQYKRERDAYLSGMKGVCVMCKRRDYCLLDPLPSCVRWQWRGVQGVE